MVKTRGIREHIVYVDLHFGANNLIKLDTLSKSDPFVVVFQRARDGKEWLEVGRTDTVYDSHKCTFGRPVSCRLSTGDETELKLEVWDRDSASESLGSHDFVGCFTTRCSTAVEWARLGAKQKLQLVHENRPLSPSGKSTAGELHVVAEIRAWKKRERELLLQMEVMVVRGVTKAPVVQFEVQRERVEKPGEFVAVHRTEALEPMDGVKTRDGMRDYTVKYRPQRVMYDDMCNEDGKSGRDETTRVRVVVFVVEKKVVGHAISRPVGWVESCVEDMLNREGSLRQMRRLSRPVGGLLAFGAIDAETRNGGRGVFARADDLLVRFSDVVLGK